MGKFDNDLPDNDERAEWGPAALMTHRAETSGSEPDVEDMQEKEFAEEVLSDMICNAMHYVEKTGGGALRAARFGIGAWSAERRSPDHNPRDNDKVSVFIAPADDLPEGKENVAPGNPGMHPTIWTYIDGLDAAVDGRGFGAVHDAALRRIEAALKLLDETEGKAA